MVISTKIFVMILILVNHGLGVLSAALFAVSIPESQTGLYSYQESFNQLFYTGRLSY